MDNDLLANLDKLHTTEMGVNVNEKVSQALMNF